MSQHWPDLAALAGLFLLAMAFLSPGLRPGQVLMPMDILSLFRPWRNVELAAPLHNPLPSDVVDYIYPTRHFAAESLRQGEFPLWNPYLFSGYPFVSNLQASLFYPPATLSHLLPETLALAANDLDLLLHLFLAGAGLYLFLRTLGSSRLAALVGGVVFMLNGVFVVWLEWHTILGTAVWLPWVWTFFELALRRGRWRYTLLAAATLALLLVGGHPQWMLYGLLGLGLYLAFRVVWPEPATRRQAAFAAALLLALGLALAAVQLLPAVEYLSQGHRAALPYTELTRFCALNRLIVYLLPNFFGNPTQSGYWGPENFAETTAYLGVLPLLLGLLALAVRRDRFSRFFAALAVLALLLVAGTPLYRLLYPLPGFNGLRMDRLLYLANLALAALAGLALDGLARARPRPWPKMGLLVGAAILLLLAVAAGYGWHYRAEVWPRWREFQPQAALFLALLLGGGALITLRGTGRIGRRAFQLAAAAIVAADLWHFGFGYNSVAPSDLIYPPRETIHFLQADPEPHRFVTLAYSPALAANTGLVFRLSDATGYENTAPSRYVQVMAAANGGEALIMERHIFMSDYKSPLLDVLNVKYIVTGAELWQPADAPDTAQPEADTVVTLEPEQPFDQTIAVQHPGLHRIDLWPADDPPSTGVLTLRLSADPDGLEVAHATVDLAGWTEGEPVTMYFSPLADQWGRRFRLAVTAKGEVHLQASVARGLRLASYFAPYDHLVFESAAEDSRIYLNEGYFPRAFFVHRVEIVPDGEAALARLNDPAFDLRGAVILEEPPPPEHTLPDVASGGGEETIEITAYRLNSVTLRARAATPGYLVLADTCYPGWQATVDGQPTHVYQADYVLRAVYLPPGEHEVRFFFRPLSFLVGAGISALALLLCAGLLLYGLLRQRLDSNEQVLYNQA
ncbi:MAG: YfhO family protein [Chloroflexota bacterium]